MRKREKVRQFLAGCLAAALIVSGMGTPMVADAAAKPRLNKKKATIRVGSTVKLKVLHKKKTVKWSSNKKNIASVSKSGLVKGKKKGTATITAKTGGKKYRCKVTVKAKAAPSPGTNAPGSTSPVSVSPSPGPTGSPGSTSPASASPSPGPAGSPGNTSPASASPSPGPAGSPGSSTTAPIATPSMQPGDDTKPSPQPTDAGPSGGNGLVSSQQVPPASAADTLTVGNMSVTLGMTKAQAEASIGAAPARTETSPLGFDVSVYNPSGDYTNYLLIQFDQDKVVGMSTISNYFTYEDVLTSGVQTASDLTGDGFSSMRSRYDYEAGYLYNADNEYVLAFVDHQGSGRVYGVEIFAKQTSKADGETNLDDLFKAENGVYTEDVNMAMAKELFDLACAFRTVKGLNVFAAYDSDAAQRHSEDMARNGFVDVNSSDGTTREDRFDAAYAYFGSSECVASRSPDAFGFITWLVDDTDSGSYDKLIRTTDNSGEAIDAYYLCTGFAANDQQKDITYATLDLFYY